MKTYKTQQVFDITADGLKSEYLTKCTFEVGDSVEVYTVASPQVGIVGEIEIIGKRFIMLRLVDSSIRAVYPDSIISMACIRRNYYD